MDKKVVYTCLFSDGKRQHDTPCVSEKDKLDGFDYIIFTNIPDKIQNSGWTPIMKELIDNHPIYTAKHYKWLVHNYLKDYSIAIYVDAYMSPNPKKNWNEYISKLSIDSIDTGIKLKKHKWRNCIYSECDAIASCKKDTRINMDKVINFLKENNMPSGYGLSEGGLILRHIGNECVNKICEELFDLMLKFTYRDQAILSFILWKNHVRVKCEFDDSFYQCSGKHGNHIYI